ncbi:DNA-binding protein [Xenorhabdus bovienii]|uniref:hypothetical protein n=1 Tax=Xenorhabdus bovienii TaxID=40576 RepID=UPI000570ACC6|nr:hypothetical protein [Xenorhabdus bovienii]MDE9455747.1 DNA-binding protein [Xenorhabdus bovienii]MDE9459314.1 DNA-binding protein [Xenorhabdus bovienii]MDE9460922.1 DNA-binding protein [Xenorhabdus bovienii]MDE9468341.1 DNA-binding protein [Xenorhabdus bovienii]MDE9483508.1 DNA-binding protein [Xenorhabdus bovienii]
MGNIIFNINIESPYVSLEKYSEMTKTPFSTCRAMVADGRIIIRPKVRAKDRVEVNMLAMFKDAAVNS